MTVARTMYDKWMSQEFAPDRDSDIRQHLPTLYEVARGKRVLELGLDRGVSTSALLSAVEEHGGEVISVDSYPNCAGFNLYANQARWSGVLCGSVAAWKGPLERLWPDVLFIDTDHTYETTKAELETWGMRTLLMYGTVLLHDVLNPLYPGVKKAMDEFIETYPEGELHFETHLGSFGLGVIKRV